MNHGLSLRANSELQRVMNAVAAGQTNQTSSAVDMANCEAVEFLVSFGAIVSGAACSIKLQQSDDDGSSDDYTDIEGSSVTVADTDDNKVIPVEIVRPTKRYIKCLVLRATQNITIDGIVAVKHGLRKYPGTNDSTTSATGKTLVGPNEGTA